MLAFFGGKSVFLGCWVIVFLGCLVAGLPDYWVVGWLLGGCAVFVGCLMCVKSGDGCAVVG
mgnify:CR=1 FL=1